MGAVAEQATDVLTIAALWAAIKAARRKHRAGMLDVVMLTMHPRDLRDLQYEDRRGDIVRFDMVRDCWTAFGIQISEKPVAGRPFGSRVIVLRRAPFVLGVTPKDWRTVTVQDMNQIVTEEF
jgi:hypothetical protein